MTGAKPTKIRLVLDTNIIISALLFGGKPRELFQLALKGDVFAVTSEVLLLELSQILTGKFGFSKEKAKIVVAKIKESFLVVAPSKEIHILKDEPDNRVLEAAVAGKVRYIVTGDKALLELKEYKKVKIISVNYIIS